MKRINLIPTEIQVKKRLVSKPFAKVYVGVVMVFFLLVFWQTTAIFRYQVKTKKDKQALKALQTKASENASVYEQIKEQRQEINEERKRLVQRLALLRDSRKRGIAWSVAAHKLGSIMPEEVWLNRMTLSEEGVILSGTSVDNASVSNFMGLLDKSVYFEGTNFNYIQKATIKDESLVEYEIITRAIPDQLRKP